METVKTTAKGVESTPVGNARPLVRGFNLSKAASAIRLKDMAALLAPTIAATIHPICHPLGKPFRANNAPISAKGRANTVCSNLIMSSVICNLRNINT
jgi:hypothetical protein